MDRESILIVDDEEEIRNLIEIYLKNEQYTVIQAGDGVEALELITTQKIDLIILDIMMPRISGIETCIKIRENYNIPIIMLSAKGQDINKIEGLSVGADDYLIKPFNPLELMARVKAQLRRFNQLNTGKVSYRWLTYGNLKMNIETHKVYKRGEEIILTPIEYDILRLLWGEKGKEFTIETIYEKVWEQAYINNNNTVIVHIRKLREKIEDNPRIPRYILTVWGIGYKFGE